MAATRVVRSYLWNDEEGRLRAPWRILVAVVAFVAGLLLLPAVFVRAIISAGVVEAGFFEGAAEPAVGTGIAFAFLLIVAVAGFFAALWFVARYVDRRRLTDYGFRRDTCWLSDLGFGLFLGAALPTLIFFVGLAADWYRVTGFFVSEEAFVFAFVLVLVLFLYVGVYEEVLLRGWLLTNTAEGLGFVGERTAVVAAVLLSSSLFGVLHLPNPGASFASAAIITLAGAFLALGYVLTGELWIPIGVHITWNFFNGSVYGFGVSGLQLPVSLVGTEAVGPAYATGGEFGPEAGLLGLLGIGVGSAAILVWVRLRGGDVEPNERVTKPDLR